MINLGEINQLGDSKYADYSWYYCNQIYYRISEYSAFLNVLT